jgi:hypothetical protein
MVFSASRSPVIAVMSQDSGGPGSNWYVSLAV